MSRTGRVYRDQTRKAKQWRFVVDVAPPGAPRRQTRSRGFRTQGDAQKALTEVLHDLQEGTFVASHKLTLDEYLDGWLASLVVVGRRRTTISSYTKILDWHVRPHLGTRVLQSLTPLDFDHLYAHLATKGRRSGKGGLSPTTVRYVATIVRKALEDAADKGLVIRNVAARANTPARGPGPELVVWSPEQLRSFLDLVPDRQLQVAFRVAGLTGLRRGELLGLCWTDIDLGAGRLTVRRQVVEVDGEVSIGPPKTNRSRRSVDLDAGTIEILRTHRRTQLEQRIAAGLGRDDDALVFAAPDGTPLRPGFVTAEFRRLVARTDLPRISLHGLRHNHAAHLVASGTHVRAIVERLGHSSASFSLDRYAHLLPSLGAEAAAAVGALVDGP